MEYIIEEIYRLELDTGHAEKKATDLINIIGKTEEAYARLGKAGERAAAQDKILQGQKETLRIILGQEVKGVNELQAMYRLLEKRLQSLTSGTEDHNRVLTRMNEIQKRVDASTKKLDTSTKKSARSIGMFNNVLRRGAVMLGSFFAASKFVSMAKDAAQMAIEAEGVERAFRRMGGTDIYLEQIRRATRGTLNDLQLMTLAVQARNFKIPLDQLGSAFEFASKRARDTGESVDHLLNSLVLGIARQSPVILNRLGINISLIRERTKELGSFSKAAFEIINEESATMAGNYEGVADRMDRANVKIQNSMRRAGGFISQVWADVKTAAADAIDFIMDKFTKDADPAQWLLDEQKALKRRATTILLVNQEDAKRVDAIKELQKEYKGFLKDMKAEEVTNDQLSRALQETNEKYDQRVEVYRLLNREQEGTAQLQQAQKAMAGAEKLMAGFIADVNEQLKEPVDISDMGVVQAFAELREALQGQTSGRLWTADVMDTFFGGLPKMVKYRNQADMIQKLVDKMIAQYREAAADVPDLQEKIKKLMEEYGLTLEDVTNAQGEFNDTLPETTRELDYLRGSLAHLNALLGDAREQLEAQTRVLDTDTGAYTANWQEVDKLIDRLIRLENQTNRVKTLFDQIKEVREKGIEALDVDALFTDADDKIHLDPNAIDYNEFMAVASKRLRGAATKSLITPVSKTLGDIIRDGIESGIVDGLNFAVQEWLHAANQIVAVEQRKTDMLIDQQGERVRNAERLAEEGNTNALRAERERMRKLRIEQEKQMRFQQTLNQIAVVSNSAVAIAKAAAEGGAAAVFTIAGTIAALVAGFAQARSASLSAMPAFAEGEIDIKGPGTGKSDSIVARLSRGESVMTDEETQAYKPTLWAIRKKRVKPRDMNRLTQIAAQSQNFAELRVRGAANAMQREKDLYSVMSDVRDGINRLPSRMPVSTTNVTERGIVTIVREAVRQINETDKRAR